MSKVAIIGFGNVGYHLAVNISEKHEVVIFGRTPDDELIIDVDQLDPSQFDYIIIAVPDSAVKSVSDSIEASDSIVLHTSGSRPLADLSKHERKGVMYPLQTFSREKKIDFSHFPIFIEADDDIDKQLFSFVRSFSSDVRFMGSANRKKLHLAAVFACNFTNHMYHISDVLLSEMELSFSDMKHLAQETLTNALELSPKKAQTGPAKRNDQATLSEHLEMINNKSWQDIYRIISQYIRNLQE